MPACLNLRLCHAAFGRDRAMRAVSMLPKLSSLTWGHYTPWDPDMLTKDVA